MSLTKALLSATLLISLAACSSGGSDSSSTTDGATSSTGTSTPPTPEVAAPCAPVHEGDVAWTLTNCGPLTDGGTVSVYPATLSDDGVAMGSRNVSKGRVTYTLTGIDWSMYPWPTDDIVFAILMGKGTNGSEVNWHLLGNRYSEAGDIEARLVTQRFDGVCIPTAVTYCEKKDWSMDKPKFEAARSYKIDCAWDSSSSSGREAAGVADGKVYCDFTDVTDPANPVFIHNLTVPTSGDYPTLNYFEAGGNTSQRFQKTNVPATMSNFRLSIFE